MSAESEEAADRAFEQRARAELRRGVDDLPPALGARLDSLVDTALAQPRPARAVRYALPTVAVALVASVLVVQPWRSTGTPPTTAPDDFALLLNADLDMLEQMEFYRWLEQHPGVLDEATASGSAQRS
jgi:hypothetical protein